MLTGAKTYFGRTTEQRVDDEELALDLSDGRARPVRRSPLSVFRQPYPSPPDNTHDCAPSDRYTKIR
jgi:hypothetical protein